MWAGRFKKEISKDTDDFNSSISVDGKMFKEDITGSIAHATMLGDTGIIEKSESDAIVKGLKEILSDIEGGKLEIDYTAEDIHMFIESELTKRLGDTGKRLHTSRSRNDQVALDTRMYLKNKIILIKSELLSLIETLYKMAEKYSETLMSGYTHLQRAQPISFGHHLLAYASMFMRDTERLDDCYKRTNVLPLGSCALAGTTYPIDRFEVAELLGFERVSSNSLDGVSDRDFCVELAGDISLIMMHLSRFSEEIILWCSHEFKYIELDDAFSTGSSIMPQKKNPDIAELVRGKSGRAYGNLISLLTMLKGLPLAYNKDMQEDKEAIFDSVETALLCIPIFRKMLETCKVLEGNMARSAQKGFINATDCADYLVKKGLPFRDAYKITGSLVAYCIDKDTVLESLTIEEFKEFSPIFDSDVYNEIDMKTCLNKRTSYGGPAKESVLKQIALVKEFIEKEKQF